MDTPLVADRASLDALLADMEAASEVAMDTEFMWEKTFYPVLCLVQIAAGDVAAAVDPLTLSDVGPLWSFLAERKVVVHAGATDLEIMHRLGGRLPAAVFDTQRAAAFLGYGDQVGYAKLVARVLGSGPQRAEGYTDWTRRPLTDAQVAYALDDVRPLVEVADRLRERPDAAGRTSWVREEQEAVLEGLVTETVPEQQWRRVSGARKLRGKPLAVLQDVTAWREREAQRRDVPRQHVVPDRVLIEVARRSPTTRRGVAELRGFHPREASRSAEPLAAVVRAASDRPKEDWPRWPEVPDGAGDPRVDMLASMFDAVVRDAAAGLELAPRLLATRGDLERLARTIVVGESAPDIPLLRGWRREAAGEVVMAVASGSAILRVQPGPRIAVDPLDP